MPLTPPLGSDRAMWAEIERKRKLREQATLQANPQRAQAVAGLHRAYPYIPPGTKVSLASAGVTPDDPIVRPVAEAAQRRKTKKGFGWHSIGDAVGAGLDFTIRKPLAAVGEVLAPVGRVVGQAVRPTVRTGMMALAAPFEEAQGFLRNIASSGPGQLGEIGAGAAGGAGIGATIGALGGPLAPVTSTVGAAVGGLVGGIAGAFADDVEGEAQWAPQSQLGMAAGEILKGKKVETGSGYFVGHESPLAQMQRQRAIAAASVKGPDGKRVGWTVGRQTADLVFEPGDFAYSAMSGIIDGTAAMKLDPSALALAKVSRVNAARRTLDPVKATEFLASKGGNVLKETLAGTASPTEIRRIFNGQLDNRLDIINDLADETDLARIDEILSGVMGTSVKEGVMTGPKSTTIAATRQKRIPRLTVNEEGMRTISRDAGGIFKTKTGATRRPFVNIPGKVEWDDTKAALQSLDSWQALAKVDEATRTANMDQMTRALDPRASIAGRLPALDVIAKSVTDAALAAGADPKVARKMGQLFQGGFKEATAYTGAVISEGAAVPGMVVGGQGVGIMNPHLIAEFLQNGVWLPDMKELQRTVSKANTIVNHPLAKGTVDQLEPLMARWRQSAIVRPAYAPRVVGEEQVRLATAGFDSIFHHPISAIAHLIRGIDPATGTEAGVVRRAGRRVRKALDLEYSPTLTVNDGTPLMAQEGMQGALSNVRGSQVGEIAYKDRQLLHKGESPDAFVEGWLDHELKHLHTDPIARRIARLWSQGSADEAGEITDIDGIKAWFAEGGGSKIREDLMATDQYNPEFAASLGSRAGSDAYVDTVVERVRQMTRDDSTLLDVAHRGPIQGDRKAARDRMREMLDEDNAPDAVVGSRVTATDGTRTRMLDRFVDFAFQHIATNPTNVMSRSPVAEQAYWDNITRMMPAFSPEDRAKALANARASKLSPERMKAIEKQAARTADGVPPLSLDDANDIAAIQASETVKGLLYDLSNRKQWTEATKLIFPFAEAWTEMVGTWSKLLVQNPQAVRRGGQVVNGARGSGFFYSDPQTGEEMFAYPGSEFVSKLLVGAPIPLKASVSGLNLFAQNPIMPGFGPLAQVAASQLIPDKPEFDWVQEAVSPFGRGETGTGFIESFMPAWSQKLRKAITSGEGDRMFNNTVYDMSRYLVSTGEFSIDTVEEQERTSEAAISMAKRMYLLRTAGSLTLPAAPTPDMVAQDKDGRVHTQFALIEEYRALQADEGTVTKVNGHDITGVGYENAVQKFLDTYGPDALLFMQPKTKGGGPPVEDTLDWIRENPDLARRYEGAYGFFAPSGGEFSMTAYERQIATGERQTLTPREAYELANSRVASMKMRAARDKVGPKPSKAAKAWLASMQDALISEYEGYNPQSFDAGRIPGLIREIDAMSKEEKVQDLPVTKGIKTYLSARRQAIAMAQDKLGVKGFGSAKKAAPLRDWLRQVADAVIVENPEFASVWDQVFSREFTADDLTEEPQAPPERTLVQAGTTTEEDEDAE